MSAAPNPKCGTEVGFDSLYDDLDILWAVFSVAVRKHVNGPDGELLSSAETEGEYRKRADKAGLLAVVQALKFVGALR